MYHKLQTLVLENIGEDMYSKALECKILENWDQFTDAFHYQHFALYGT